MDTDHLVVSIKKLMIFYEDIKDYIEERYRILSYDGRNIKKPLSVGKNKKSN